MDDTPQMKINTDSMKTVQELVTDAIRDAILRGRFRPGDKLDQTELAAELQVSRSPVREALRVLTAEDLVTHYRHRGTVVKERSVAELEELLFIRKLLEGAAARRAVACLTEARLLELEAVLDEADQSTDMQRVLELNNIFHSLIYSAYDQQTYLMAEIQKMRNKIAPYNRLYLDGPGQKAAAWADHRRIYEACFAGDPDVVVQETERHLDRVSQAIMAEV